MIPVETPPPGGETNPPTGETTPPEGETKTGEGETGAPGDKTPESEAGKKDPAPVTSYLVRWIPNPPFPASAKTVKLACEGEVILFERGDDGTMEAFVNVTVGRALKGLAEFSVTAEK